VSAFLSLFGLCTVVVLMNRRFEVWSSTIRVFTFCGSTAVFLAGMCFGQEWRTLPQTERPREKLHGVLSRQRLTPPLRSARVTLRYSHDGRYLLLQDPSGIYVLSREPLNILGYIDAPNSYPARFSGDSRSIVVVSLGLFYEQRSVVDGHSLDSKALPIRDGCVDAQLSPNGELLACYRPDFSLGVLELSTDQWIFSDVIHTADPHLTVVPILLDVDTPFAGPFGFALSHDMKRLANRAIYRLPMTFSPDGSTLIAGDGRDAVRVDLVARKKTSLPGAIQKDLSGTVAMQNDTRVLVIPLGKPSEPAVRSLTYGNVLATPNFKADFAELATDTGYALLNDSGMQGARVFDLEHNRPIETPKNIGVDVRGGELAVATNNGDLFLYGPGEHQPSATVLLPFHGLRALRSASVTPDLDKLAIAVDGEGGLFQIANGKRIASLPQFFAINFEDAATGFLLARERRQSGPSQTLDYVIDRVDAHGMVHAASSEGEATHVTGPQTILRLDTTTAKSSLVWMGGKDLLRSGGPVFLEYSFESPAGRGILLPQANPQEGRPLGISMQQAVGVPFRLSALEPATGKELWSRSFVGLPPIPFADSQGERLVLSWKANSLGGRTAARHQSITKETLKGAKLTDQDSFLEVIDTRTGKSVGGVLVQSGAGPTNFDSIFSTGQAIIFSRDSVRVYVYSMFDGQLKARLVGLRPSANAQSNLLTLDTGSGHLAIYDLSTAAPLDEQIFPDAIAYTHFSIDGQRLFVLTENQEAFVLDMKGVRGADSLVSRQHHPATTSMAGILGEQFSLHHLCASAW
jgi:hypothetical protein